MNDAISLKSKIVRLINRQPFAPFMIVLNSGERHQVLDPMRIAMGGERIVILPPRATSVFFQTAQIAEILETC